MKKSLLLAVLVAIFWASPVLASGFSDSFEGTALDPFWSVAMYGGVNNLAVYSFSSEQVRSGAQSLKISYGANGIPGLYLEHLFATPVQGAFSVWYYDTTAPIMSGLYIADSSPHWASLGVSYGDWASADYGYFLNAKRVGDQSLGWHHYESVVTDTGTVSYLDGVLISYAGTIVGRPDLLVGVDRLLVASQWGNNVFNPGNYVLYIDDFSFTPVAPVPEPATMLLLGSGLVGLAGFRRRFRKR